MKKVYEYKLYRSRLGDLTRPEWSSDGGYFHFNNTELTVEEDDATRAWYIPDTVNTLTFDQFKQRVLDMHQSQPWMDKDETGVIAWVNEWWAEKVGS